MQNVVCPSTLIRSSFVQLVFQWPWIIWHFMLLDRNDNRASMPRTYRACIHHQRVSWVPCNMRIWRTIECTSRSWSSHNKPNVNPVLYLDRSWSSHNISIRRTQLSIFIGRDQAITSLAWTRFSIFIDRDQAIKPYVNPIKPLALREPDQAFSLTWT